MKATLDYLLVEDALPAAIMWDSESASGSN